MTRETEREADRREDYPFAHKDRLVFDALTNWEAYKRESEKIDAALLARHMRIWEWLSKGEIAPEDEEELAKWDDGDDLDSE